MYTFGQMPGMEWAVEETAKAAAEAAQKKAEESSALPVILGIGVIALLLIMKPK